MSTYTSQTKDKSLSVSTNTSQELAGGETTSAVVDNRPVAIAQQQLQTMASKSPHVVKNTQLQAATKRTNQSRAIRTQSDQQYWSTEKANNGTPVLVVKAWLVV